MGRRRRRSSAIVVLAGAAALCGAPRVGGQDGAAERGVRVVARWVTRYERDIHNPKGYGGPPLVTYGEHDTRNDVVIVAREEALEGQLELRRWIIEDVSYHLTQGAITAAPKDEPRYLKQAPIAASFHFTKSDFDARLPPSRHESLAEERRRAESLRRQVASAARRGTPEGREVARSLRQELAGVEASIRATEFLHASHELFFSGGRRAENDWGSASICLPRLEYTRVWWEGRRRRPDVAEFRFDGNADRRSERSGLLLPCLFSAEGPVGRPLVREVSTTNPANGFSLRERTVFIRTPANLPPERDHRLLVSIPGYATWEPQATRSETNPGNELLVEARVVTRGGGEPGSDLVRRFTFELAGTSAEPGVAINYPPADRATRDPDLRFTEDRNVAAARVTDSQGQSAEVEPATNRGGALISSYDWGAHAHVLVTAELDDGRLLFGELEDRPGRHDIPVPRCRDGSRIPEHRRIGSIRELPDDDDSENTPAGDGFRGDGLTLYEEYRGFYENGEHLRCRPGVKDLFIRNEVGAVAETGIALFSARSGLAVHQELRGDELDADRCINFNRADGGHRQHGILMGAETPTSRVAGFAAPAATRHRRGATRPITPGDVDEIAVSPGYASGAVRVDGLLQVNTVYTVMIAHELGHSCGMEHHGTGDRGETWTVHRRPDGRGEVRVGGEVIELRREDGTAVAITPNVRAVNMYLGVKGGQHSGRADCFMRYACAQAYTPEGLPRVRHLVKNTEVPGTAICSSATGSGVNAAGRSPHPRYGDASKGNCQAQMRVSDR